MRNRNLAYMTHSELIDYLESGEAVAIAGCGSVEQHGPHQLLGTDYFFTQIFMDYTAEECNGMVVPIMPFSWIGGLRQWAGTIDIRSKNQGDYLESMCIELIKTGFNCVVLINGHGGGREMTFSAARRVFKDTGVPVLAIYASNYWAETPEVKKIWKDYGVTDEAAFEPSMAAAGMIHLGLTDAAKNLMDNAAEQIERGGDHAEAMMPPQLREAFELGDVSHSYWEERRHSRPSRQINAEAGRAVMREAARTLSRQIADYRRYADGSAVIK